MDELMNTAAADIELPMMLPVDANRIQKFNEILQKYKAGKKRLERRVIQAEQWWKLRNEEEERKQGIGIDGGFRAKSGWLHNVIVSKHADAEDNYPEPVVLPREPGDIQQAETLSAVLPVILDENNFSKTYSDAWWRKLKTGTAVYKVTWDQDKLNGLGDIAITDVDLLSLFWEPGVTDIQASQYFFHCELQDNEVLESIYPQLKDKLTGSPDSMTRFIYDDTVSTEGKSLVTDVYYKQREGGQTVLHYAKYVNDVVLASTENDGQGGLYDHGKFPFVFDPLWPIEGSPAGYGYIDLCWNPQTQLDMLDTAFLRNAVVGATPRYFQRSDGMVNAQDFTDLTKPLVTVKGGSVDDTGLRLIETKPLAAQYINFYQNKVAELRETSGNTETSTGSTSGGVTAASAIAALQEASGKTSRDSTQASYRAFADICKMMIELIRQFYNWPRIFRIQGENGDMGFVEMDNTNMLPYPVGLGNEEIGWAMPVYDIKVEVQKRNAYSRVAQNELALQLYSAGFFNPQQATPALMALSMMDFEGKDELTRQVSQNGTLFQQLQQLAQIAAAMAQQFDPTMLPMIQQILMGGGMQAPAATTEAPEQLPGLEAKQEATNTAKARERTAQTTAPKGA